MKSLRKALSFLLLSVTSLGGLVGVSYASWVASGGKDNANTANQTYATSSVSPVCYNASTNKEYPTIRGALNEATSGQYIYQYIGTSVTESQSLTIKSGVHLVLPFVGKANKNDSTSPIYDLGTDGVDHIADYGGNVQGDTSGRVATYRKCLLNLRNGADIIVNSGGYLHVGGVFGTLGNRGYYSEINLGSGSHIDCSGTFDCYGFVKENSVDAVNPIKDSLSSVDNSSDAGRYITIQSTGTLNSYMAMYDALSGGGLATCIQNKKYCPFWSYDFPAMQTYTDFYPGASFSIGAIMVVGTTTARGTGKVIGSSNALFILSSGKMSMEYSPTSSCLLYSSTATKTNMAFDGQISLSSLSITVSGQTINTSDFFLPICYKQRLFIPSTGVVNLNSKVKFLNESELHIANGGTLNVNHQTIFYTRQAVTLSGSTKYTHNGSDSLLDNNGTLVVNNNNAGNGKLAAIVTHTNQENTDNTKKGKIDLTKATSGSLSVTAIEDGDDNEVTVSSKALFIIDNSDHTQGVTTGEFSLTKEYYSGYDASFAAADRYYWIGEFVSTVSVTVTVLSSTYRFPLKYYTLKSNTSASATGAEVLAEDAETTQTFTMQGGLYINFSAPYVAAVAMTINGATQTYNASSWFKITSGAQITVTPAQGFKVKLTTTGTNNKVDTGNGFITDTSVDLGTTDNTDSGRGTTTVQILASTNSSSGFSVVAEGTGDCTIILARNQYYRLYCSKQGTNSNFKTIAFTGKYYDYDAVAGSGTVKTGFDLANTSNRDANTFTASSCEWRVFTFGFKAGASCVTPDTLVTMADGSQKPIKYVTQGEMIRVWNHETGQIDIAPVTFNEHDEATMMTVTTLSFSDGTQTEYIYEHGYFDVDLREYVYFTDDNYAEFVGHRFLKVSPAGEQSVVTLTNATQEERWTDCYSLPSYYHLNFFADDFLSMPGGIKGLFNIFELDETFKYDEAKKAADIEKYGLFTREELAALGVDDETYDAYPAAYLKVSIGKGIMTEEDLMYLIERYGKYTQ